MKQRTRLLEQFDRNVKERDALLLKKKEALSTLSNFEYTRVAGVEEYVIIIIIILFVFNF